MFRRIKIKKKHSEHVDRGANMIAVVCASCASRKALDPWPWGLLFIKIETK